MLRLMTFLMVLASLTVILGRLSGRPVLFVAVTGDSMAPAIRPHRVVPILPIWLRGDPGAGDVIVFRDGDQWIIHRVIGGDAAAGWITRGDANLAPDPRPVKREQVAGVAVSRSGKVLQFPHPLSPARAPASPAILLAVPFALAALLSRRSGRRRRPVRRRRRTGTGAAQVLLGALLSAGVVVAATLQGAPLSLDSAVERRPVRLRTTLAPQAVCPERRPVRVENRAPIPLVITVTCRGGEVRFQPPGGLLWPGDSRTFTPSPSGRPTPGSPGELRGSLYPPFLPPAILARLEGASPALAVAAAALTPAAVTLALALLDSRFRRGLRRGWERTRLRAFPPRIEVREEETPCAGPSR